MSAKTTLIMLAFFAGVALAQAAGGIKGQRAEEAQQRFAAVKGPRQQQQQEYLPPPPPPQPQPLPPPPPPRPVGIKGPGQVAPIFTQRPVAVPVQVPVPVQIVQQQQQEQEPEPAAQQQQQEEVDPNAAAQDAAPAIAAPARAAASEEEANPRPEPYAFNYAFESGDSATSGSSTREEQQDASGKVTGFYTLRGEDGRDRRVDYVADASGFRATISTNEMGTAPKDSADVDWNAQNPTDAQLRSAEIATEAARQRALLNPQQVALSSTSKSSFAAASSSPNKISSPRQQQQQFNQQQQQQQQLVASAAKGRPQIVAPQQQQIVQLQEPFEQIRQVELKGRARKSRHAPFYLFTI